MFKITNTSKSSGTHQFQIALRGRFLNSIRCERKLREVILRSIEAKQGQPVYDEYMKLYNSGDLLAIMRDFGMITKSIMIN